MKRLLTPAIAAALIAVAFIACAPSATHCVSSTAGTNPGDNTRTQLAASIGGSTYTATPGAHVTLDGSQLNGNYTLASQASGTAGYFTVASGSGDQACIANTTIIGNNSSFAMKVNKANFVLRDMYVGNVGTGSKSGGDAIRQNANDFGIAKSQLDSRPSGGMCIKRNTGDNIYVTQSYVACGAAVFDGNWGTGDDHGIWVDNSTLKSDYGGWFINAGSTPVQIANVKLRSATDVGLADYVSALHGYDVPSGAVGNCDGVDIYWLGTGTPGWLAAWQSACTNVTIHTSGDPTGVEGTVGSEGPYIIRDGT